MRCDAMRCDATRRDAMRCDAMRCDAMRCDTVRCDTVRCGAVRFRAVRCGAVLYGAVRCGVVRCDVLRRGMMHPRPLKGSRARVAGARYRWRVVCVPVASTRDVRLHAFPVALTAATALRIALAILLESHERNRTEHVFVVLRVRISPRRRRARHDHA